MKAIPPTLILLLLPTLLHALDDLPEAPTSEPTPAQQERDRLLKIAFYEAYLEDDAEELYVATGAPRTPQSTPWAVTVVTGARLRELNYTSLADALAFEVGLFPDWRWQTAHDGGLVVRGAPVDRLRVLIDGLPADHGTTWQSALARIPLNLVRRVEIMRAPGGGLYADALGATINVVTRSRQRPTLALAELSGGMGSLDDQRYFGRFTDQAWRLGYKVGGFKWSHAGAEDELERDGGNLDGELTIDFAGTEPGEAYRGATLSFYARTYYGRLGTRSGYNALARRDDLNLEDYGAELRLPLDDWGLLSGQFRYGTRQRSRYLVDEAPGFQRRFELEPDYYEAGVYDGLLRLDVVPWNGARLGLRLDGWLEEGDHFADERRAALGTALSCEQAFFDGLTQLNAGVRYDDDSAHGGFLGYRLGLLQGFSGGGVVDALFANLAAGRRPPTLEEEQRASSILSPEVGLNGELGLRLSRLRPLELQLCGFYRRVDDAILPGDAVCNRDEPLDSWGGELELTLGAGEPPWLRVGLGRLQTEEGLRGSPLSLRLNASLVSSAVYPRPLLASSLALAYRERFFHNDLTVSGEAVLNYLNYRPALGYPGEATRADERDLWTLDLFLRARVIDFDIGLRFNNLIGGGIETPGVGYTTEPLGVSFHFAWVFYD